jgi:hypothetical protein
MVRERMGMDRERIRRRAAALRGAGGIVVVVAVLAPDGVAVGVDDALGCQAVLESPL